MKLIPKCWSVIFLGVLVCSISSAQADRLRIGVTLHPYYSWLTHIVGDYADVVPVIPAQADPHAYQPRPEDLIKLGSLDVLVTNGLGHDAFVEPMLKAVASEKIVRINPNNQVPLIHEHVSRLGQMTTWNSHSYISIVSSIQLIANITDKLANIDLTNAQAYRANANNYKKKLRGILADALKELDNVKTDNIKLATVHDGYNYLFQELGLNIAAVIQPRHGIDPSPKQMADTIKRLNQVGVQILFTELDYGKKFTETVVESTGVQGYQLSHISTGAYSADQFTVLIKQNLQQIVKAIKAHAS